MKSSLWPFGMLRQGENRQPWKGDSKGSLRALIIIICSTYLTGKEIKQKIFFQLKQNKQQQNALLSDETDTAHAVVIR